MKEVGSNRIYVPWKETERGSVCGEKGTARGERDYMGGQRKGMKMLQLNPFLCMLIMKLIFKTQKKLKFMKSSGFPKSIEQTFQPDTLPPNQ